MYGGFVDYLYINNWCEWQSYRKDRGTPPWIKVHRTLLSNPKWAALSDAEKGQLISIWIVAADAGGKIPTNPIVIKKICQLDAEPNISKFKHLKFLLTTYQPDDNQMATTCQPLDVPETETEVYSKEIETEKKERGDFSNPPPIAKNKIKGTRLSEDWELPDDWGDWAISEFGWDIPRVVNIMEKFKDHWLAKAGADGVKLNWQSTWKNWCRRENEGVFRK